MWLDRESQVDLLAYEPFAELITNIAANKRLNPLTIGLFGRWGAGKSTLLKLVEKNIEKRDVTKRKLVCISLNSWMFEGYDDAKSAIMESLLRTLMDKQPAFEGLKKEIKNLIGRINFMKLGSTVVRHGIPFVASAINPTVSVLSAAQYFSKDKRKEILEDLKQVWENEESEDNQNTTVENIRLFTAEFTELIEKSEIDNLVVMIDDLDRCTPERVIETLEAVKLFLSVPKTTFIIAVDNQVIRYSIENKYPKITEGSDDFSDSYIEKIIQLPIHIPELSEVDIKNYLLLLICELYLTRKTATQEDCLEKLLVYSKNKNIFVKGEKIDLEFVKAAFERYDTSILNKYDLSEFEQMFNIIYKTSDVIAGTLKGNPRQAKRFLNSFLIRKSLAEIYYKNDIDFSILAKMMALEYMDTNLFKELYKWALYDKDSSSIKDLEDITKIAMNKEEMPEQYRKWSDEKNIRWLKSEPVNIYEKKLLKYFYLTRESLDINIGISDSLSQAELEVFNKILQAKRVAEYSRIIKGLKEYKEVKYSKVIDALVEQFKGNKELLGKIQIVYINYEEYRIEIRQIIKKLRKSEINLPTATILSSMYQVDKEGFSEVISQLEKNGIDSDLIEIITEQR